jgi:hypothetical protein
MQETPVTNSKINHLGLRKGDLGDIILLPNQGQRGDNYQNVI